MEVSVSHLTLFADLCVELASTLENPQASDTHGGSQAPKWPRGITSVSQQSCRIDLHWEPQEREGSAQEHCE